MKEIGNNGIISGGCVVDELSQLSGLAAANLTRNFNPEG